MGKNYCKDDFICMFSRKELLAWYVVGADLVAPPSPSGTMNAKVMVLMLQESEQLVLNGRGRSKGMAN
jgi:hypothetical protein